MALPRRGSPTWRALEKLGGGRGLPAVVAGLSGQAGGVQRSAGFSVADYSDATGKHLQRATTWSLPTTGILMWYGAIDAVTATVSNVASGFLVGHIGASTAEAGAYVSVDNTGQLVTFGRRNASGGAGAGFSYTHGASLIDSTPRLYWAAWGWSWGGDTARVGIGDIADGTYQADATITTKTGAGNSPSFLARNTNVVGDGSVACTQAWAALVGRELTATEWANLAAGNLDILRGSASVNFGLLPAASGDILLPSDVEDIGSDGGDWNDATRGTGTVEVQGVGL